MYCVSTMTYQNFPVINFQTAHIKKDGTAEGQQSDKRSKNLLTMLTLDSCAKLHFLLGVYMSGMLRLKV